MTGIHDSHPAHTVDLRYRWAAAVPAGAGLPTRVTGTVVATGVLGWEGVVPLRLASTLGR